MTELVPKDCGEFCKIMREEGRKYPISYQGDPCSRCPIFLSSGDDPLMKLEDINPKLIKNYLMFWGIIKEER